MAKDKEQYFTPKPLTRALLQRVNVSGRVFEPCAGKNWITEVLQDFELEVDTNDIDESMETHWHFDATKELAWTNNLITSYDFVVTNPPFSLAAPILKLAYKQAKVGVAFLVRLSFLEPCAGRDKFLLLNPPSKIIVLPRTSFTQDGQSDTVTCCWLVWFKDNRKIEHPIEFILREFLT